VVLDMTRILRWVRKTACGGDPANSAAYRLQHLDLLRVGNMLRSGWTLGLVGVAAVLPTHLSCSCHPLRKAAFLLPPTWLSQCHLPLLARAAYLNYYHGTAAYH